MPNVYPIRCVGDETEIEPQDVAFMRHMFCCDAVIAVPLTCHSTHLGLRVGQDMPVKCVPSDDDEKEVSSPVQGMHNAACARVWLVSHANPCADTAVSCIASGCPVCANDAAAPAHVIGALLLGCLQGFSDMQSLRCGNTGHTIDHLQLTCPTPRISPSPYAQ